MKLLVATSNRGKLVEVREILAGCDLQLTSLADLGLTPPEEPFETFQENAAAKAATDQLPERLKTTLQTVRSFVAA